MLHALILQDLVQVSVELETKIFFGTEVSDGQVWSAPSCLLSRSWVVLVEEFQDSDLPGRFSEY